MKLHKTQAISKEHHPIFPERVAPTQTSTLGCQSRGAFFPGEEVGKGGRLLSSESAVAKLGSDCSLSA